MTKPFITKAQINELIEKLDDACLGKTPFTCADGTSSDRLATQLHNTIHDFFDVQTIKTEEEFIDSVYDGLFFLADHKPAGMHDYDAHRFVVKLAIDWAVATKKFLLEEHMKQDGDLDITRMGAEELGILQSIQTLWFECQARNEPDSEPEGD